MEIFKLLGTIAVNNQQAISAIDGTTKKADTAGTKMLTAFKKIGTAIATYVSASKIIEFGKACIEAAANAQAMESQFAQVFGEMAGQASEILSSIAESSGVAENRMKGSFTKIAAFAKTTGLDTADALALSERAMIAVADSAAFYDRTLEDTTESLQSFLKGNYENDAALGLSCTEITRNAVANELYGKSFKDLSEAQKQLALLKMVEDANAASGALGQAARESQTWANETGNLKQAWKDLQAAIGETFLDTAVAGVQTLTTLVVSFTEKLPSIMQFFTDIGVWVAENKPLVESFLAATLISLLAINAPLALIAAAVALVALNWDLLKAAVDAAITAIGKFFGETIPEWWNSTVVEPIKQAWEDVKTWINNARTAISGFFTETLPAGWDALTKSISEAWGTVVGWIQSAIDALKEFLGLNGASPTTGTRPSVGSAHSGGDIPGGAAVMMDAFNDSLTNPRFNAKGAVFSKPTLFNTRLGGQVVGEAGPEAVAPIGVLQGYVADAVADSNNQLAPLLAKVLEELRAQNEGMEERLINAFASMRFDVNNREFARMVKAVT